MSNPSGTKQSIKKYSNILQNTLSRIFQNCRDYQASRAEIEGDQDYTLKEREKSLKTLSETSLNAINPIVGEFEKDWKEAQEKWVIPNAGTVSNAEIANTMQIILNTEGAMAKDTLLSVLKPIERDLIAVRAIHPVINKMGLNGIFTGSRADHVLKAGNKLDQSVKDAKEFYQRLVSSFANFDDSEMPVSLNMKYFVDAIHSAEQAYTELQELVSA